MFTKPDLTIYEKAFAKSDKTDAVLVVDGKKLHVNKAILSYHSDYFKTLFNGDFKEKSMEEIEIKDVDSEDFATLLSLIHENPLEINYNNVENLLILADQFILRGAKLQVERFICYSQPFSRYAKLNLADKYKLENHLKDALSLYSTKEAFRDFYLCNTNLSAELKLKLFDMFFNYYGSRL